MVGLKYNLGMNLHVVVEEGYPSPYQFELLEFQLFPAIHSIYATCISRDNIISSVEDP